MPIKCPVAPLEFTFLADAFFAERGMRDRVEIAYVTPLGRVHQADRVARSSARCSTSGKIALEPDFMVERIDPDDARRWSPMTSARCRSTCWSRFR